MKRVIYYLITIFLLVHTSCERDNVVGKAEGEDINLSFMLSDYSKEDLSSQSRTTESNATSAEKKVKNIWVIQFKNHTTLGERTLIGTPRYVSGNINANLNISGGNNNYIFLASLKTGEDQILYLVANTDDGDLYKAYTSNTTEETFLETLIPVAKARDDSGRLVMVGKLVGNISRVDEIGQIHLANNGPPPKAEVVQLHRRLAKVEFTYTIAEILSNNSNIENHKAHFKVSSITLNNAPKNATAQPSATTDALLKDGTSYRLHNNNVEGLPTNFAANTSTGSYTFYVPEIIGGIETIEPNEHESWKIGDFDNINGWPDYKKLLSHIEIKGVYTTFHMKIDGSTYDKVEENVSYKIYLGEDMLDNYNVMANTHYKVTCNINTIFKGDRRITITTPPTL